MSNRVYYSDEAESRAKREQALMALIVLGLGVGIGALVALLFAPKSGEAIRSHLGDAVDEAVAGGREASQQTLERLEQEISDLRDQVSARLPN
jgi:gas vesicle protein